MTNGELQDLVDDCLQAIAIHRKAVEQAECRELDDVTEGMGITYSKLSIVGKELELRQLRGKTMHDDTEDMRRVLQAAVNLGAIQPEGQEWTTEELARDFNVLGFMAPYVVVERKSDSKRGSLMFRHSPRVYFGWQEDK